jgi:Asp-tRNA(Asn)/Glu-tRNA(Gln) amidotransferase A subunit family amidase
VDAARARFDRHPSTSSWLLDSLWPPATDGPTPGQPLAGLPIAGLPIAVKSNFAVAGLRTRAGSRVFDEDPPAAQSSPAVVAAQRAGAVVIGTLNMNELAYGFTGRNTTFGNVPNPHDPSRVSGGSSSASGAIVGAGVLPAALGTDTNGSIRVPAALCGVFGFRPSSGAVSTAGIVPLSTTLDMPGIIAADVDVLIGLAAAWGVHADAAAEPIDRPVVRVVTGYASIGITRPMIHAIREVAAALYAVDDVDLPWLSAARAGAQVMTAGEAARTHMSVLRDRSERLEPLTHARLLAGLTIDEGRLARAHQLRDRLRSDLDATYAGADILVLPTVAMPAPSTAADVIDLGGESEPINVALGRCTIPFSFVGGPSISVPFALPGPGGLPMGVQLVGRPGCDATVLRLARFLQISGVVRSTVAS